MKNKCHRIDKHRCRHIADAPFKAAADQVPHRSTAQGKNPAYPGPGAGPHRHAEGRPTAHDPGPGHRQPHEHVQPAAQQTAFNMAFNRKDGTDELNSILGLGTEKTAEAQDDGQEIKAVSTAQDNSAVFAGNVPQKTEVVTADAEVRVEAPLPEQ